MPKAVNIQGIDKAALLAAFYNNAKDFGGALSNSGEPDTMTRAEAASIIRTCGLSHNFLKGRMVKVDLNGNTMDPAQYNRNASMGASAIVDALRKNSPA